METLFHSIAHAGGVQVPVNGRILPMPKPHRSNQAVRKATRAIARGLGHSAKWLSRQLNDASDRLTPDPLAQGHPTCR